MKRLFLFLSLLIAVSSFASREWLPTGNYTTKHVKTWSRLFETAEHMPVFGYKDSVERIAEWGYQIVYNCETDGGASDHVITKARWEAWIVNTTSKKLYLPKMWVQTVPMLGLPDGLEVLGDDSTITYITMPDSVTTSYANATNNYGFTSYGRGNIKFHDFSYTCGNNRMAAIWLFNASKGGADDIAQNISFDRVHVCYSYATAIKGGGRSPGQTTHIEGLSITNSELDHLGNPANLYNILDGAADSAKCHGLDAGSTVADIYFAYNKVHDCSGDGFNSNAVTTDAGAGYLLPQGFGKYTIIYNEIYNTYSCIVPYGSFIWYANISHNYLHNWTGEGGFAISGAFMYSVISDNTIEGYEGRAPFELYGAENDFDFGTNATSYLARNSNPATWRINTKSVCDLVLTAGYNNTYWGTVSYDSSKGVSPKIGSNLRGIYITGQATVGNQPQSWKGKSYPYGYYFHCTVNNANYNAVFGDANGVQQAEVHFTKDFKIYAPGMRIDQNLIQIYAPARSTNRGGWYFEDCQIDLGNSPTARDTVAIIGFASPQTTKSGTVIHGLRVFKKNNTAIYLKTKKGLFDSAPDPRMIIQDAVSTHINN